MENWLATLGAVAIVSFGAAALIYSLRKSGDEIEADSQTVENVVESIDRARLSNLLSKN